MIDFLALQKKCEHMQLGFYFEEGGCFGMALALKDHFEQQGVSCGLAVQYGFLHAYCVIQNHCFDYTGRTTYRPTNILTVEQLIDVAIQAGHSMEDIEADKALALEVIRETIRD